MSLMFHRPVLLNIGGLDEDFDLCEDWDLIIRIGAKYSFYHIKKITAKYSFWSKESQVTIGNEKLSPYRLKILSKYSHQITPQVLYNLIYEGKWLGNLTMRQKLISSEEKITELEKELASLRSGKENGEPDLIEDMNRSEMCAEAPVGIPGRDGCLSDFPKKNQCSLSIDSPEGAHRGKKKLSLSPYPTVSIIIRVRNEGKMLGRVLDALRRQDYPSGVEVIIVDSGSTDNTLDIAAAHKCSIVKVKREEFTFGRALNIGYQAAAGEIFVNVSGHSIPVDEQFLKNLIAPYEDPLVMGTFGRNIPLPEACPSEARDLDMWYPAEVIDVPERFSNGNSSLRRTAWEKIPFNDEVSGSEDIIWAKQIMQLGFEIVYVPGASVYHSHSASPKYAFVRRLRETKAIITKGQSYEMPLGGFLKWTITQALADARFARWKHYDGRWYFHILPYRFFQGLGIYVGARGKRQDKRGILEQMVSSRRIIIGYSQKSYRVVKNDGWDIFFRKAKRRILTKLKLMHVSLEKSDDVAPTVQRIPSPRKFRVTFIVDPLGPLTNHYRAHNMQEYFKVLDIESQVMLETALNYQVVSASDIVVLCRVFMNPHIEKLIEMCRTLAIPVVFDADDFVIDPSVVDRISSLEGIADHERSLHVEGLRKHRASFDAADFFTAPTHYLTELGRGLGKSSFIIRNGLSLSQVETCKKIMDNITVRPYQNHIVKIGYFSGTKSHQKDFSIVVPALLKIMDEFPHVHLYVGGYLDLNSCFDNVHARIKRLPFVDIERLPYNLAKVDINIAPLETNNPFCEAKSELKYFDAGLLRIPTVASPVDAYKWAIRNGSNGFLADSPADWYDCLKKLVEDAELRTTMGQRAYEHVMACYTPNALAPSAKKMYEEMISEYRRKIGIPLRVLKISFVIPCPTHGSGGHNKIFTAAKHLSESGHRVSLYFLEDGNFTRQEQVKEFIHSHYFDPKSDIILGANNISTCDVLCATSWLTAYTVYGNKNRAARLFYFVQDIESLFFPMGDNYIKAENTYRLGLHHITYGPWCAKILSDKYRAKADAIPFSLDKTIYYPRTVESEKNKRVIFFARPEMSRRCFWLGLEALCIFNRRNPDVKIILYGTEQLKHHHIPFPHEDLGVMNKDELARLYSGADVGLVFSTTNPSLVPFEMMACACPVVDLDHNDNYINYGSRENVKLVGFSPEEIARGIEDLIHNDTLRHQIAENGFQYVINFPDDREAFGAMEDVILNAFGLKESPVYQDSQSLQTSRREI